MLLYPGNQIKELVAGPARIRNG